MKFLVIGSIDNKYTEIEKNSFKDLCINIGKKLHELGHTLIICSPFEDSADYWILKGFTKNIVNNKILLEWHYVDNEITKSNIEIVTKLYGLKNVYKIPHAEQEVNIYSWLLCQLEAIETCNFVISIGGKLNGSANMLLLLAESKRIPIIPFHIFGGAAFESFTRNKYELKDKLGIDYKDLLNGDVIFTSGKFENLIDSKNNSKDKKLDDCKDFNFFISYPRARPSEADYIETLLRRRNLKVFRDESAFGAGSSIPTEIKESIYRANIFIAIWCVEYACSPWCFDELELALDRYESDKLKLWIFCPDETRIVPNRARDLLCFKVKSREEIECVILKELQKIT